MYVFDCVEANTAALGGKEGASQSLPLTALFSVWIQFRNQLGGIGFQPVWLLQEAEDHASCAAFTKLDRHPVS